MMPAFVIMGKDALAPEAVEAYGDLCIKYGLHDQAAEVQKALTEIIDWQRANPDAVHLPNHRHVPVTAGGSR
jgi:hypothetical protein